MTRLNKIKIYFRILAAVLIITLTAAPGITLAAGLADSGQRVFDYAGLFDSVEEEQMQKELEAIISHTEADVVILTIDDAGGKEAVAYADDFFDEEGFGIGNNYDGVLFLIDMDNRELTVSTSGSMIAVLPDYRLELMLDHIYEAAGEDNFKESAWRFITDLKVYYDQYLKDEARTAYNIAEQSEREKESAAAAADSKNKKYEPGYKAQRRDFSLEWYEVLLSLGVAAFVAICVCKSVVNSYRMKGAGKGDAQLNLSYRSGCHMNNVEQRDTLIDRSVTTQVISRPSAPRADFSSSYDDDSSSYSSGRRSSSNSSSRASGYSTTHTSSSGRTHGGSSRSFSGGSSGGGGRNSSGGSRGFSSGSSGSSSSSSSSRSSGSSSTHSSGSSSGSSSGPSSSRSSGRSSGGGRSHGGGSRKF